MKPLSEYLQLRVEPLEQVYKGGFLLFSMKTQISYASIDCKIYRLTSTHSLPLSFPGHRTVQVPLLHETLGRYCLSVSSLSEVSLTICLAIWRGSRINRHASECWLYVLPKDVGGRKFSGIGFVSLTRNLGHRQRYALARLTAIDRVPQLQQLSSF